MKKDQIKILIGVYSCAMSIMGMLVPVPIVAQVAASFPSEDISLVQMIIGVIPLFMAVSAMLVSSILASRVNKKVTTIAGHCLVTVAGLAVALFLHNSLIQVLVASSLIGIGLGAVQNSSDAIIADYFEGKDRSMIMGVYSTFVALGGVVWVGLSGSLGSTDWTHSYYAYLGMIPLIIIELIFLPKGHLEPKRKVNVFANMPTEVRIITVVSFIFVLTFQLFSSNVSLLVAERGLGGTSEAAMATTAVSLAGIPAGLLVGGMFGKFKNLSMPVVWTITLVGLGLTVVFANALPIMCVAGFVVSLGKEMYTPLEGNFAAGNSAPEGRAFNLAIGMAGINFGMALSPLFFGAASAPFGGSIESKFYIGMVICLALIIFGFVKYKNLTPAQIEEAKRMEAAAKQ